MPEEEKKTIELEEMNVILRIPVSSASVTVTAMVIDENDELVKVCRRFSA